MRLIVTRRATENLAEIYGVSEQKWGARVAEGYLDAIDDALDMLVEHPGLLRKREDSDSVSYYTVRKHLLICTVIEDVLYVLMVAYGGMDVAALLDELEPALLLEAQTIHTKLRKALKKP